MISLWTFIVYVVLGLGAFVVFMVVRQLRTRVAYKRTLAELRHDLTQLESLLKGRLADDLVGDPHLQNATIRQFRVCSARLDELIKHLFGVQFPFRFFSKQEGRLGAVFQELYEEGIIASNAELALLMEQRTSAIFLEFPSFFEQPGEHRYFEDSIRAIPSYLKVFIDVANRIDKAYNY